jgi:pimeloyl-ACP methyl ester carboxylesterase
MGTIAHTLRGTQHGSTRYSRAGRGEPIVPLHGLGMQASVWSPQVDLLKNDYDVVTFDMLGHGGSSLPPVDAVLSDYSDQLLSLLDGLGIAAAHLAGHSMGALISLEFALAHPARVRSVAALNGVYCRTPLQKEAVGQRASMLEAGDAPASPDDTLMRWFGDPVPASLAEAANTARSMLQTVNPLGYARTYRLFASSDERHRGRLEKLAVPALFMTGALDANSTPSMSQAMADAAPLGRFESLPGERHMMTMTAPAEVTNRLRAFHREIAQPAVLEI